MIQYTSMNLKEEKLVAKADRPSFKRTSTGSILKILLVNGAAIEASASDNESPISAVLRALQSFAPSPHIPTIAFSNF